MELTNPVWEEDYNFNELLLAEGYEVQHVLGSGSGGNVYKALQLSTGQAVAIKVMYTGDLEPAAKARRIERFRREIGFCSSLYHPDIVRLLDSGKLENDGRFAVFEFVPGKTLAELLRDEGMLTVRRARNLMAQVLPALAYLHERQIAHRDLKPGNVMVSSDDGRDRVKLLDFGISVSTAPVELDVARLTQSHEWLGTPLYASPEQLRGDSIGPKSDIYAWALMFVECLTGAPVVSGRSLAEIIAQQFHPDKRVLPLALARHRLGALLLRALERDPARRLGDARQLRAQLDRISLDALEDGHGYLVESTSSARPSHVRAILSETLTDTDRPVATEQRRVTVLCCRVSLVGAGGVTEPSAFDALLDDSKSLIDEVLQQFGAVAGPSLGGYSLWYFGLALARDGDARLAVRGALEVVNRMEKLPSWFRETGFELELQVGLHSGSITVQLAEGQRVPMDGVTARVAMELASREALPGESREHRVLVSDEFRQVIARYTDTEPLAANTPLDASALQPPRVYVLKGESRPTSLRAERTPFVGRSHELQTLTECWAKAKQGLGCAVLLEGEAGVGKSRLATEFATLLEQEAWSVLEARCLPEWQNARLRPLRAVAADIFELTTAKAEDSVARVERGAATLELDLERAVPLLCDWFDLPIAAHYKPLTWSPQKRRQMLHELVVSILLRTMASGQVLLLEDLHWADPSTLECLDLLLTQLTDQRALVLFTSRPEAQFTWTHEPTRICLSGLDGDASRELVRAMLAAFDATQVEFAPIVSRADGVPLYLEELVGALQARSEEPGHVPGAAAGAVPPSLQDLLTSRLDRAGAGREMAQFAAALGREFSFAQLLGLAPRDELALMSDLEELVAAQVLLKRLRVDSPVYTFRHALIRDAAYDSMPASQRQRVHESIAEGLERSFKDSTDPDVFAHHFERAGVVDKAIGYWKAAAQNSQSASAHAEAINQIDRALSLVGQLESSAGRNALEADLLLTRGATVLSKRGYTDPDAKACFDRIAQLAEPSGQTIQLHFFARWCIWYHHNTRANLRESVTLATELFEFANAADASAFRLPALSAMCQSRFCTGRLEEAVAASRECARQYDFERDHGFSVQIGDDPCLSSCSFEALAEMVRGRHQQAEARIRECFDLAERLAVPALVAGMHGQAAWAYLIWGDSGASNADLSRALHHSNLAMKFGKEHGFPFWELYGWMINAAARIADGDVAALPELEKGAALWEMSGARLGRSWHLTFIGLALKKSGRFSEALAVFDRALAFCEEHEARYFEGEVRRQRAEVLGDAKNPDRNLEAAIRACRDAAERARAIGAYWWELCSLTSAVRLGAPAAKEDLAALGLALEHFPSAQNEPPLLREARALAFSAGSCHS